MAYSIQTHVQYNAWANGKIVEFLLNLDEKLFDTEVKSSFPSLRKTLCHIQDAEQIWLSRIKGISPTTWPSDGAKENKTECIKHFRSDNNQFTSFFSDKEDDYFEKIISFKTLKGDEFSESIENIIFHVVNHGSFHRGQIITMLRELGITELPVTDLIRFMREQKASR